MGIPSYFSHIIKKYGNIIKKFIAKVHVDNLYLDSNSIIYDSLRNINYADFENDADFENTLYREICAKIEEYIAITNPSSRVLIAFDGIAPVAKLKQQKTRRFRSKFIDYITQELEGTSQTNAKWDSAAITPGTQFMHNLDKYMSKHFNQYMQENNITVIYSGANNVGEGEHKIFDYIRANKEYHSKTSTFIYGLDSDLIMLCLNHLHISKRIYLFRESPDFASSLNENVESNVHCYLDIDELSSGVLKELGIYNSNSVSNKRDKISDYIFISFMLGNDFMPHFPALNIRTNGIPIILETYKNKISPKQTICKNNTIQWKLFKTFMEELCNHEHMYIKNEYKIRAKWQNRHLHIKTTEDKLQKFNELPFRCRDTELFIDPFSSGWQYRYYKKLLHVEINNNYKKNICVNYLEGLEWTLKYYSEGCVNYRWYYKHDYPPLLEDIVKYIPSFDIEMIDENKNTISSTTQLAYVLPKKSLHLLPSHVMNRLVNNYGNYYLDNYKFEWSFCKYFWESHPIMKYFDIDELEKIVDITR